MKDKIQKDMNECLIGYSQIMADIQSGKLSPKDAAKASKPFNEKLKAARKAVRELKKK